MAESTDRLERLLETELGSCCAADVDERVDRLRTLRAGAPADADADRDALGTLGDETRYALSRFLVAADRELCVCELEVLVDVSDSAVSHALSDLASAGLVERRKEGTWRYYRSTARAAALLDALDATRGVDGE